MTRKSKLVEDLKEYFASKGKFLTYNEYIAEEDAPYRPQIIKRAVGSWARLQRMVNMTPVEAPAEAPAEAPVEAQVETPKAPVAKKK